MENKNKQNIIIAVILGFILGFGSAWVWTTGRVDFGGFRGADVTDESLDDLEEEIIDDTTTPTSDEYVPPVISGDDKSGRLSVSDQKAGVVVFVDKVVISVPAWVVIYEDVNGEPSNILGAHIFDPGTQSGEVELLRGTSVGGLYYAIIHDDDGDRQFDYANDLVERDETTGMLVQKTFKAL